jgi:hypothetical protein
MMQPQARESASARREALGWLADQVAWETRLDGLRRPRRDRDGRRRAPRPGTGLRRAS